MNPPTAPLTLDQALGFLQKLAAAAPPPTSARLRALAELLQRQADENAYLNSMVFEAPAPAPEFQARRGALPQTSPFHGDSLDELFLSDSTTFIPLPADEEDSEAPVEPLPAPPGLTALGAEATQLFGGINDALRAPLVAIRSRAELVQSGILGQITPEQDAWLEAIQDNANRAFAVLDSIQEMVNLRQKRVRSEPVNFLATDLLTEGYERQRDQARRLNHTITIQAPDLVPLARGDFYQCLIVLNDLLDNALRYTPPGGQIRLSVDNLGTHVLLSVADNGTGLTPDDLARLGEPFWRGTHHKLVRAHAGTGLRLYLARLVLAQQGGELIFSGEPGVGSTFSFTLPIPE